MKVNIFQGDCVKEKIDNINTLLEEIQTKITAGTVESNSTTGVSINHLIGNTNYSITVTATEDPNLKLGELWVVKESDTATIYNSGEAGILLDYIIVKH